MKTAKMVYRECNEFRVTTFERQKILHLIVLHCQLIAFLLITVNELDLPRGWSQRGFYGDQETRVNTVYTNYNWR
jgi:hypothetical protein